MEYVHFINIGINTYYIKSAIYNFFLPASQIHFIHWYVFDLIDYLVLNATFSNISAISWRPVLVVEEAGVPGENHRSWASNW
jgi:hypothetical protein